MLFIYNKLDVSSAVHLLVILIKEYTLLNCLLV